MKIPIYDGNGDQKNSATLKTEVFCVDLKADLIHRSVIRQNSNARNPIAHTLTRGEVSVSTKKIFKQKGTGNARRGAKSTNILRGGGVTHGPSNMRNFTKMMPKKERRVALFSALSLQAKEGNIFGLENILNKTPKTKDFIRLLSKLPEGKKYLFVMPAKNEVFEKSARNIPSVSIILATYISPLKVLWADKICFVGNALEMLSENFLNSK